jgi:adenylosuccinate synthase
MITQDYMIWDMQFGSTGKGLLAGYLANRHYPDGVVSAWAPNAGHTFIDSHGYKTIRTMLPIGTVVDPRYVFLGPGSVIDVDALGKEVAEARDRGWHGTLVIHQTAAIVTPAHREAEKLYNRIGSTQKGSAQAVIEKMERNPVSSNIALNDGFLRLIAEVVPTSMYLNYLSRCRCVQVEAAQGHSLSIDHGFYPYTTSRDTSPLRVLADCGWPLDRGIPAVYGTARTYPIRVANRFNERGEQVGWSGPCYPDQREMSWAELDRQPELTTVTKLPRRIFTFSEQQIKEAALIGRPDAIFLNFMNYLRTEEERETIIGRVERAAGCSVQWLGYGAREQDVHQNMGPIL